MYYGATNAPDKDRRHMDLYHQALHENNYCHALAGMALAKQLVAMKDEVIDLQATAAEKAKAAREAGAAAGRNEAKAESARMARQICLN